MSRYIRSISLDDMSGEDSYIADLPAVKHLSDMDELSLDNSVTFIVGENGTGKSTLLEGIAVAFGFNPEGGTRNFSFATNETHSPLHEHLRLIKTFIRPRDGYFLRAESFYNAASYIETSLIVSPALGRVSLTATADVPCTRCPMGKAFSR